MRKVIDTIYNISEGLHAFINGEGTFGDKYMFWGKLYDSVNEVPRQQKQVLAISKDEAGEVIGGWREPGEVLFRQDFRENEVEIQVVEYARDFMVNAVQNFCVDNTNYDEVTMLAGCVLNLYHVSGLFDRLGRIDIDTLTAGIADRDAIAYIKLEESFILSCVAECYAQTNKDLLKKHLGAFEPKQKEYYLELLTGISERWQFANMYRCITAVQRYIAEKSDAERFVKYADVLEKDLLEIAFGLKEPSSWQGEIVAGELKTTHPELFSTFGFGIPYIKFTEKKKYEDRLVEKIVNGEPMDEGANLYQQLARNLRLPCVIAVDVNVMAHISLLALELRKARTEKRKIINQFSHTYKGLRATSLYNIATSLLGKEDLELKKYGRQLMLEFGVKKNLTKDVEMLQLCFEDRIPELQEKLQQSVCIEGEEGVTINHILDNACKRCIVTLLYDGSPNGKNIRKRFVDFDLIDIRNRFEEDVLYGEKEGTFSWFSKNVLPISFEASDEWSKIRFLEESYAELLITSLLAELITNVFKYADKTKEISFVFTESEDVFEIKVRNYSKEDFVNTEKGGVGLEAEAETLGRLNSFYEIRKPAIMTEKSEGVFVTRVSISKAIFEKEAC